MKNLKRMNCMKKTLSLLLAMVLLLGLLPVSAFAATAPAKNGDVYQLATAEDMLWFADLVNNRQIKDDDFFRAELIDDVTLPKDWPGIGTGEKKFVGTFDGKGHTVTFSGSTWGLFGSVMGGKASDTFETVQKETYVVISNVRTRGTVHNSAIAASAGYATIKNCINGATIVASTSSDIGGILGTVIGRLQYNSVLYSDVTISQCGNEASITADQNVGGILGSAITHAYITECYNTHNVSGNQNVGGMAGYFQGSNGTSRITCSYNTAYISGGSNIGGIAGLMYNGAKVDSCYNASNTANAIVGGRFNHTVTITNSYYLGTLSLKSSPDYTLSVNHGQTDHLIQTRATALSATELGSQTAIDLLGDKFQVSCPTPVLAWQESVSHTGSDICSNCGLGREDEEIYTVSFQEDNGFTLIGAETVQRGHTYRFRLEITPGYLKENGTVVKVNGVQVTENTEGWFEVPLVKGPLTITVQGVILNPGVWPVHLPGEGYGYRIDGEKTVDADEEYYEFGLTFLDGFAQGEDFTITAQEVMSQEQIDKGTKPTTYFVDAHPFKENTYRVHANVQADNTAAFTSNFRISVSGVALDEAFLPDPVTISFRVTQGWYTFYETESGKILMNQELTVPYFDLANYGLQKYYYNPNCYVTNGVVNTRQQVGNAELAFGNITAMHAFIAATERFYLGYEQDQIGKNINPAAFAEAVSWSQDAGSSFMSLWDHGTNLNYYLNFAYPLAYSGWGSTSDQEVLENGDELTVHMITGAGSGSRFGVFVYNDTNGKFNVNTDERHRISVPQGQSFDLTLYWTGNGSNYSTTYTVQPYNSVYWIKADEATSDIRHWNRTALSNIPTADLDGEEPEEEEDLLATALQTDENGIVHIDTSGLEPGTYYIAAPGAYSETGGMDAKNQSAPAEAGAALFTVEVRKVSGAVGDVNEDGKINAKDSVQVLRHAAKKVVLAMDIADVNNDNKINAKDAAMILRYAAKKISEFPRK